MNRGSTVYMLAMNIVEDGCTLCVALRQVSGHFHGGTFTAHTVPNSGTPYCLNVVCSSVKRSDHDWDYKCTDGISNKGGCDFHIIRQVRQVCGRYDVTRGQWNISWFEMTFCFTFCHRNNIFRGEKKIVPRMKLYRICDSRVSGENCVRCVVGEVCDLCHRGRSRRLDHRTVRGGTETRTSARGQ